MDKNTFYKGVVNTQVLHINATQYRPTITHKKRALSNTKTWFSSYSVFGTLYKFF